MNEQIPTGEIVTPKITPSRHGIQESTIVNTVGCNGLAKPSWRHDAASCAEGLRLYADKFHPETETYPEVQAELERIFAGEVTA